MLPDGPPCVHELRLSLAPSSVLPCPMLGFRVASAALAASLGLSWAPCPSSASWGFVPRLVARLAPCSRWRPLTGWSSLKLRVVGGSWFSLLCSPGRRSASRSTFSALSPVSRLFWVCSLLLWVGLRPLPDVSLGALWLPVRWLWSSLRLRVCEGSSSLLGPSPSGVCHLSRASSSVGGPVGVAHSFHPSLLLGGGLVRFCGGLCCRSLAMS